MRLSDVNPLTELIGRLILKNEQRFGENDAFPPSRVMQLLSFGLTGRRSAFALDVRIGFFNECVGHNPVAPTRTYVSAFEFCELNHRLSLSLSFPLIHFGNGISLMSNSGEKPGGRSSRRHSDYIRITDQVTVYWELLPQRP